MKEQAAKLQTTTEGSEPTLRRGEAGASEPADSQRPRADTSKADPAVRPEKKTRTYGRPEQNINSLQSTTCHMEQLARVADDVSGSGREPNTTLPTNIFHRDYYHHHGHRWPCPCRLHRHRQRRSRLSPFGVSAIPKECFHERYSAGGMGQMNDNCGRLMTGLGIVRVFFKFSCFVFVFSFPSSRGVGSRFC